MQSHEQRGSLGEPMGKREAVQGRPFALVRAYADNTPQECVAISNNLFFLKCTAIFFSNITSRQSAWLGG